MRGERVYDAVIVGSGPTGGYAAKALSEAGLNVLVLEAGRPRFLDDILFHGDRLRRRLGYLIEEDPAAIQRQRVQSSCYAWAEHPHAFVDDLDNPYTSDTETPFVWLRSRQVGGRMRVRGHGLQFYRFSDLDFHAGDRDGASPSWPISYTDLAPYYDRVERWMQIHGSTNGLPHLPDARLAGERGLNPGEQALHAAIAKTCADRLVIPGRTARPPLPILAALRTGRCALQVNAVATRILSDPERPRVTGVVYRDRAPSSSRSAERTVLGRTVVLAASAIESARLLLASGTDRHPNGLANGSDVVGRYLMDHTHLTGINADMRLSAADRRAARSWAYIPRFQNLRGRTAPHLRGYGIQVFTEHDQCALTVFGEMLPHRDNRVTLDSNATDRWGVPAARISCTYRENEIAMRRPQVDSCAEMLETAGFHVWRENHEYSPPGLANHEAGTVRMGRDPAASALNEFCQSWEIPNLFVVDGASFVTQAVQNPTLTMLALAARAGDRLIDSLRRGDF